MIEPHAALELVRSQLRSEVLTQLDPLVDDYAHSVVVAALGVLREVSARVVNAEQWCEASVTPLRTASRTWPQRLAAAPEHADRISKLIEAADETGSLAEARRLLLDAAETAIEAIWEAAPAGEDETLLREIRELLLFDTKLELDYVSRET